MSVQNALQRAEDNLQAYIPNDRDRFMTQSYWALVDLFQAHVHFDQPHTVLAGALAVYGWMPTMLRRCDLESVDMHTDALQAFRVAPNGPVGREALQNVPLNFVNGSVVGTSKFLHFLNPNVAPIWDRRVARAIGAGPWNPARYSEYWADLDAAIFDPPMALQNACAADNGRQASPVRLKEVALYLTG